MNSQSWQQSIWSEICREIVLFLWNLLPEEKQICKLRRETLKQANKFMQFNIKRETEIHFWEMNLDEQITKRCFQNSNKLPQQSEKNEFFSSLLLFPQTNITVVVFNKILFPKQVCCSHSWARKSEVSTCICNSV